MKKHIKTELPVSVIYLKDDTNDINEFDFFIRTLPVEEKKCISVSALSRFSMNEKMVNHLKFSIETEKDLDAYVIVSVISQLRELERIVSDKNLTSIEA